MKKSIRKIITSVLVIAMLASCFAIGVLAAPKKVQNDTNPGTGQTQTTVHNMKGITDNKGVVYIVVNGQTVTGVLKGESITFEMGTTDNLFHGATQEPP